MEEQRFNEMPSVVQALFDTEQVRAGDLPPDEKLLLLRARKQAIDSMMRNALNRKRKGREGR